MMLKKFCIPLVAAIMLLFASAPTWARGPAVSIEIEGLGPIDAISTTVKGPRGKTCDASKTTISIVKLLDVHTPALMLANLTGDPFPAMTISIGGAQFWLENVFVESISTSSSGDDIPTNTVILSAAAMSPHQPPDCD